MAFSFEYRELADQARDAADGTNLPLVKVRHLEAAARWDSLAEEIERYELPPGMSPVQQDVFW